MLLHPRPTYVKSKQRRSTSIGRWVFVPGTGDRCVTCDRGAKVKTIPVRLSCFYRDNHIIPDDLMVSLTTQAVTMSTVVSVSRHRLAKWREAVVNNENLIVFVSSHRHYTCNDTARRRLQTGRALRSGRCRSCVFRYGWFLKSFSSLEFLVHVCRQRHTATEPRQELQRRCLCS